MASPANARQTIATQTVRVSTVVPGDVMWVVRGSTPVGWREVTDVDAQQGAVKVTYMGWTMSCSITYGKVDLVKVQVEKGQVTQDA
jgi:hypothetical protein